MKRLIPLLLVPSLAHAVSGFDFTVGESQYELYESSVRASVVDKKTVVTAMWEARLPNQPYRWIVNVTGCDSPYGTIVINGEDFSNRFNWTIEGTRTYDLLALHTCVKHQLTAKPGKTSEDRAKKY